MSVATARVLVGHLNQLLYRTASVSDNVCRFSAGCSYHFVIYHQHAEVMTGNESFYNNLTAVLLCMYQAGGCIFPIHYIYRSALAMIAVQWF
ncbi:hypothetical protein D9M68_811320 [compost metagenome]